ncbi:MAG TPA: hypothetical protein VMX35_08125 [Acidobacteriota bacterium]|nr:hypothetical protein [Acidobacteriota bacterium]
MTSYNVIYRGPSVDEDPAKVRQIADQLAFRSSFSMEEALERMARTPFVIGSGMEAEAAIRHKRFLESLGAEAEVVSANTRPWTWRGGEKPFSATAARHWYIRDAWRGILSIMASGLLLGVLIAAAGIALALMAPLFVGPGSPPEILSAVGWSAMALGFFVLITTAVFRLPALVRLMSRPDQSSPESVFICYLRAINDRNWSRGLQCLAGREESRDLGAGSKADATAYFRSLVKSVVLPRRIESSNIKLLQEGADYAVIRFKMDVLSRKPAADGSYQRRVFSEAKRFRRIEGLWYLIDGFLLGHSDPGRLPLPACPECGEESELGRWQCPSCGMQYAATTLVEEEWQPPRRRPDLAAVLSAVVPGLGQAYNGQMLKGLLIAATCWTILPWIGGVIDALRTAERVNRNDSFHDLPRRTSLPVVFHLAVVIAAASLLLANLDKLPAVGALFSNREQAAGDPSDPLFTAPGDRFTILFPHGWSVEQVPNSDYSFAVRSICEESNASVMITGRSLPERWQPCPQARAAREKLEAEGSEVAHMECGSAEGRFRYRVDSYSPDRSWRRSLIAIALEQELVVISFACPASRQDELVPVFEQMIATMEFLPALGHE